MGAPHSQSQRRDATQDTTQAAALTLDGVSFGYGGPDILRAVTLRVRPGERVGLLGPNGAGKSTLLRLASCLLRPRTGRVLLGDDDARTLARGAVARRVAVVPQDFAVQFAYTVRQLTELGRTAHAGSWGFLRAADHAAVEQALAATELEPLAERVFNELSGGERQRVLVAMALAQASPLLLLDEPTAHLDIRHQIEVLELLSRLNQERGLTVIAALHDLNLAARYFPRLVLFRNVVVADGPPSAVLDAGLLSRVYETPVQVGILRGEAYLSVLPPSQTPLVTPRGEDGTADGSEAPARVHVVAGGGSGELMMRSLADAGIPFTAGALNVGDSDYVLAAQLAVRCVAELPYAPIAAESLAATRACMAAAEHIVICPAPFGPGNAALLEAAAEAARGGRSVLLLESGLPELADHTAALARFRERDFTGGRAVEAYAALLDAGARLVAGPAEVSALAG